MKDLRKNDRLVISCGSLNATIPRTHPGLQVPTKTTVINIIEANERTPLFKDNKRYGGTAAAAIDRNGNGKESETDSSYGSENDSSSFKKSLVGKPRTHCGACTQMMAFILIIASGCIIGAYLLIAESRLPKLQFSLDLVHHDLWSTIPTPLAGYLNHSSVENIVIMQTGGSSCETFQKCLQILHELQMQYQQQQGLTQEIPFNFLIGGDRLTYDARGWYYESGLPFVSQNVSLVIAFIGNYTTLAPTAVQLHSALSLIAESVRQKKLQRQYKIFGLQKLTNHQNDAQALVDTISRWQNFAGRLQLN